MRIWLCAVGRLRGGPERELVDRYLKRARGAAGAIGVSGVDEMEILVRGGAAAEAEHFRRAARGAQVAVFDERGEAISSACLARIMEEARDAAVDLAFFIGGPDGVDPVLRREARRVLSFGAMTWPHDLARAMAAEQIYRGLSILGGHPYHRDG